MPSERADVCVVGSGPAGAVTAHSLATQGHDVVVLEAGKRFDPEQRRRQMAEYLRPAHDQFEVWDMGGDRDAFESSGRLDYPLNSTRVKGVGGTTLHWIGIVPRFHEKDFEMHTRYGLASDWPIDYADVRPYYAAAEREVGVAGATDNPFEPPREESFPMDAFPPSHTDSLYETACEEVDVTMHSVPHARNSQSYDDRAACQAFGTCDPVCPSGAKYDATVHVEKAEVEGARVIDRAPVQRLEHDESGERVEVAVYTTPDKETHHQTARQFVLAAGAIETPRLLLLSRSDAHPDGLANASGAVGRYLMDHPFVGTVALVPTDTRQHQIGFMTSESHQFYDHEEATPGSIKLEFMNTAGPSPVELALADGSWGDELITSMRLDFGTRAMVGALVEQLPNPANRVTLASDATDDHGNPVPEVVWDVGEHAIATLEQASEIQAQILAQMEGRVIWSANPRSPLSANHPMGTTRMGADPAESVVDERLRTHDLSNLTIASSSVFRTGAAMNPTLTIVALSLKAADHVDADL